MNLFKKSKEEIPEKKTEEKPKQTQVTLHRGDDCFTRAEKILFCMNITGAEVFNGIIAEILQKYMYLDQVTNTPKPINDSKGD